MGKQNEEWLTLKSNNEFPNFETSEYLIRKGLKDILRRNSIKRPTFCKYKIAHTFTAHQTMLQRRRIPQFGLSY